MPTDLSLTYLYNSITDTQGTIRAIDNKLNYLLVILILPLTKLTSIYEITRTVGNKVYPCSLLNYLSIPVILIFTLSWILAFVFAMRGLIGIDNPVKHIRGSRPNGTFYGGNVFIISFFDSLINREIQSEVTLDDHLAAIPLTEDDIRNELVFEQMKLVYIRSIKMERHKNAYQLGVVWIIFGGMIWLAKLAL